MNREKITHAATNIVAALEAMRFTPDETVALLKCLDQLTHSQAIDREMIVTTKRDILAVIDGRKNIREIGGQ